MVPTDLRYSKEHEWVQVEEGVCTVGITHFAQDELGFQEVFSAANCGA